MHALYLHGFGSGPKTAKGTAIGKRLAGAMRTYGIPDLEAGDFRSLTMESLFARALAYIAALPDDGEAVLMIGSSLGGYAAATLAARGEIPRVAGLLLIAPAFGFPERWSEILGPKGIADWRATGERLFYHHAAERELPLSVAFLESCMALPSLPLPPEIPVVIVHGRRDETVDWRWSRRYADQEGNIELHLVDGDHRLTDQRHEDLITWCAQDLIARIQ
jgi:hypothetical protein